MIRRQFFQLSFIYLAATYPLPLGAHPEDFKTIKLSDEQWLRRLSGPQYDVLRLGDTEFAGSSPLNAEDRAGTYHCVGCDLVLFESRWKYESGTGWPSFWKVIPGHVIEGKINGAFRAPIEYHCAQCGGHQGHVFDDGPQPSGLRYCNNGIALKFIPQQISTTKKD